MKKNRHHEKAKDVVGVAKPRGCPVQEGKTCKLRTFLCKDAIGKKIPRKGFGEGKTSAHVMPGTRIADYGRYLVRGCKPIRG